MQKLSSALQQPYRTYHFARGKFADEADTTENTLAIGLAQVLLVTRVDSREIEVSSRRLKHVLTAA